MPPLRHERACPADRHTGAVQNPVQVVTLVLGGALTIVGSLLLVTAFRHGQSQRRDLERRDFRRAVAALALGSILFFVTVALTPA